ncbi:hypothetical protein BH11ACT8_BH11ACT8_34330 [soil metagenome]
MSSRHPRFVTLCQQLLVLGVICAALTPAANVLSLDFVPHEPGGASSGQGAGRTTQGAAPASMAAYVRASSLEAAVPTTVVDPVVEEYPLTAAPGARVLPGSLEARSRRVAGGAKFVSSPQPVSGYGAVGVTWQHGTTIAESDIDVEVRTQDTSGWSDWMSMSYSDEHGPDPDSEEAARARPGTDELLVGNVDQVQVRIDTRKQGAPADLKLAVIDPGVPTATTRQRPAIDTGTLPSATPAVATPAGQADGRGDGASEGGDATLAATAFTPKPQIFSRAQWGADERMRDASSLHYYEVHAGFVHHTVNANNYKARDVPAILRGIYAYHTRSRGWSDIGYNYLVDRFGRIWEGRYGGVDRPVVGAHTLGYNDDAFAMSAIGNYEEVKPSNATVEAYGALFAWKLSLHGVYAGSKRQYVTSRYFQAINGHRDAAATACPGKYLYAKIPKIRRLAAQAQVGFGGRQLEGNLAATDQPDLIVRRASDGQGFILPIKAIAPPGGTTGNAGATDPTTPPTSGRRTTTQRRFKLGGAIAMHVNLRNASRILNVGDWDRDGFSDLVTRRRTDGTLFLRRGLGNGSFGKVQRLAPGFKSVGLLAAVGDTTGDGYPDLMGQPRGGSMMIYPGKGMDGVGTPYVAYSRLTGIKQMGIGLWNGDGAPDNLVASRSQLKVYAGNGPGGLTTSRVLPLDLRPYDWVVGIPDVDLVGHPDLVVRVKGTGKLLLVEATAGGFSDPVLLSRGTKAYSMIQ